MSGAQRLKRVFGIEIETCLQCGGKVKVIASIEDPAVIARILWHVAAREAPVGSRPPALAAGRDAVCSAQSGGFEWIGGTVVVRLPAPGSSRGVAGAAAGWQTRRKTG